MRSSPSVTARAQPLGGAGSTAASRRSLRVPRTWGFRPNDAAVIVLGNAALIVAMWVRHGQLPRISSAAAVLTAAGQVAALLGTYSALVQVVLMSRTPWLDDLFGIDRITGWHRILGFSTVYLIGAHVVFTTAGYAIADGRSLVAQTGTFLSSYQYMAMAYAAAAIMVVLAVLAVRAIRRRMSHETWHFVHFAMYLAIALAFGHELAVGTDFVHDPVALWYWVALYGAAALLVLSFRIVIPIRLALRHRLRVHSVVTEASGVHSLYITGRDLADLPMRAGQFFKFRFLTRELWWQVHPFSLSAAPNGEWLRITIKGVGDFSESLGGIRPGTAVMLEGPYGLFTSVRRRQPRCLLIAGGIGITPLRALIEEMPQRKNSIVLLYRARSKEDIVFKDELDQLVSSRGGEVRYIIGRRGQEVHPHPFAPRFLLAAVPDLRQRDVFICGPKEMITDVTASVTSLNVPARQIHVERFAFIT